MNKCFKYEELLSAYIDDELSMSDKKLVEEHIETCQNCANLLYLYREMSSSISDLAEPVPLNLSKNVMDKIRASKPESAKRFISSRMILTRYVPIAACLAIALLILPRFLNIQRGQEELTFVTNREAPVMMMATVDDADLSMVSGVYPESEPELPESSAAPDNGGLARGGYNEDESFPVGTGSGNMNDDIMLFEQSGIDEALLTESGVTERGFFAFIILGTDLPETMQQTEYEIYYLISREDALELIELYDSFIIHLVPGDETAEQAIIFVS
jgi:hypothetical protein